MDAFKSMTGRQAIFAIFLLIVFIIFFSFLLSSHILLQKSDGLYSAGSTWGDLPWHLTIISNISEHGLLSTLADDPVFPGVRLSYPFIPALVSSALLEIGFSMRISLILPSILAIIAFLIGFYFVALKISGRRYWSMAAPFIFLFNGSMLTLGYFWRDLEASGLSFLRFLSDLPRDYAHIDLENFHFSNIIADYILPQRAFVFGLFIGLIAVYFLWKYWNEKRPRDLLYSSLIISILPLVHTHSFLTLGMVGFFLLCGEVLFCIWSKKLFLLKTVIKRWLIYFCLPLLVIAMPQFLIVYPFDKEPFLRWGFGWMKGEQNIFAFWLMNLFPHAIVLPFAYWLASKKLRSFYNAFLMIFVVTNLIVFQPYIYDNMKFMLWWFLLSAILIATLLGKLWDKWKWKGALAACIITLSLTLTGLLSAIRESELSWKIFSNDDVELAEYVRKNTNRNSIFLTGSYHNNPISSLAGRNIVMGYGGWLWAHGMDYSKRAEDIFTIYSGQNGAQELIGSYDIKYTLLNDPAVKEYSANREFLDRRFGRVFENSSHILYKTGQ